MARSSTQWGLRIVTLFIIAVIAIFLAPMVAGVLLTFSSILIWLISIALTGIAALLAWSWVEVNFIQNH